MRAATFRFFATSACLVLSTIVFSTDARAQGSAQAGTAPRAQGGGMTPSPAPVAQSTSRRAVLPQGFSVVLVLGDLQAPGASDDVPLAARKALTDMKDFLPFKSYRLLDASWLLCCSDPPRRGTSGDRRSSGSSGGNGSVSQVLRGPDDQEYELKLTTSIEEGRIFVRFSLTNPREWSEWASNAGQRSHELATIQERIKTLEATIAARRESLQKSEVERLEKELAQSRERLATLQNRSNQTAVDDDRKSSRSGLNFPRSVMDTSFTMDVGETVVVGTSRLRGGNRALIALLTAVPPNRNMKE